MIKPRQTVFSHLGQGSGQKNSLANPEQVGNEAVFESVKGDDRAVLRSMRHEKTPIHYSVTGAAQFVH
jgi:hypothetical protein